jgi:hypothetical protein
MHMPRLTCPMRASSRGVRSRSGSTDPELVGKDADTCGLYLAPPENAIVFTISEQQPQKFPVTRGPPAILTSVTPSLFGRAQGADGMKGRGRPAGCSATPHKTSSIWESSRRRGRNDWWRPSRLRGCLPSLPSDLPPGHLDRTPPDNGGDPRRRVIPCSPTSRAIRPPHRLGAWALLWACPTAALTSR